MFLNVLNSSMNWKYYYNYLKQIQKTHSTQQYCLEFLKITEFNGELLTVEDINNYLSQMISLDNPNFNLFPFSNNLQESFNLGDYHLIAQIILQLPFIDLSWMSLSNPQKYDIENFYLNMLNNSPDSLFQLNNISIPRLLINNTENHLLTFLFILFLPTGKDFYHLTNKNNSHICSTPHIAENNFKILLEISKDLDLENFQDLCKKPRNISIELIENFMDNSVIVEFKGEQWLKVIPLRQLELLAKENCIPFNISELISINYFSLFSELLYFLDMYSHTLLENILNDDLSDSSSGTQTSTRKVTKF